MGRTPEPELMLDPAQARAYASADFAEAHDAFVAAFARCFGAAPREAVDLGIGAADVAVRFARRYPGCRIRGIEGAPAMRREGEARLAREGLTGRVEILAAVLPDCPLPPGAADAVLSNSLLHHLADPLDLWRTAAHLAAPGACLLVMDLVRPASPAAADELVARHAAAAPMVLQRDFLASLHAAYTVAEVAGQIAAVGLSGIRVEAVGDRHWIAQGRLAAEVL